MIRLVGDSRCGSCGSDANGSRLCWRCQAQHDVTDANRSGTLPDPTPDESAGHSCFDWTATPDPNDPDNVWICDRCGARIVAAEQQARLDLSQDAPTDPLPFDLGAEIALQTAAHRLLFPALYEKERGE